MHSIKPFAHLSISLGNTNYNYSKLKQSFNHLSVPPNKSFNLMKVGIILGQYAYELLRPLDYKIGTRSEPFAVLTELGWLVIGRNMGKKKTKSLSFRLHRRCESCWEYPDLVGHRRLCFQNQRRQSVNEGTASTKDCRECEEFHRPAVRSGNAVEWTRATPTQQLQLSLGSAFTHRSEDSKEPQTWRICINSQ